LHALAAECSVECALIAEAAALYESGLSLNPVGEWFGVSANAVQDAFVAAGIPRRPERRRR
jgi:hypothetical protein